MTRPPGRATAALLLALLLLAPAAQAQSSRTAEITHTYNDLAMFSDLRGLNQKDGALVLGQAVQNPSFETEFGWTPTASGTGMQAEYITDYAPDGKRGFRLAARTGTPFTATSFAEAGQKIDLTGATTLTFDARLEELTPPQEATLLIDGAKVWSQNGPSPGTRPKTEELRDQTVDVSRYPGPRELRFRLQNRDPTLASGVWGVPTGFAVDNLRIKPPTISGSGAATSNPFKVGTRITAATPTLQNPQFPPGTGITISLSNDNGATWTPAPIGGRTSFTTTGNQLRYRLELSGNGISTPTLPGLKITLEVENKPPTITGLGPATAIQGQPATLQAQATDPDGDPLTTRFTITAPNGLRTTVSTPGTLYTFTPHQPGAYTITAQVTDGSAPASRDLTLTATPSGAPTQPDITLQTASGDAAAGLLTVKTGNIRPYQVEVAYHALRGNQQLAKGTLSASINTPQETLPIDITGLDPGDYELVAEIKTSDGAASLRKPFSITRSLLPSGGGLAGLPLPLLLLSLAGGIGVIVLILIRRGRAEEEPQGPTPLPTFEDEIQDLDRTYTAEPAPAPPAERPTAATADLTPQRRTPSRPDPNLPAEDVPRRGRASPPPEEPEDELDAIQKQVDQLEKELEKLK